MENFNARRIWLCFAAIAAALWVPNGLSAQPAPDDRSETGQTHALPVGDEQVRAIHLLTIPRATSGGVEAAVACDDSVYLAGKLWNKEDKSNLWVWRVDPSGKTVWEKHLARQVSNEEVTIVGLLAGARKFTNGRPVPGVRVVYRQGLETRLVFLNADGKPTLEKSIGLLESTHGVASGDEDKVFLFGRSMVVLDQPTHAWVAQVTRLGAVLWKHTYHGEEEAGDRSAELSEATSVPAGSYEAAYLFDGVSLKDGSAVFVGQTGVYNKFGQGPSKLWLLRLDRNGRRLAQVFIDGGRLYPSARDLIAACEDGVIVPYSTEQLPAIAAAPLNMPPGFGVRLARFNARLDKLWDKPLGSTIMPGAATITGPAPFVSLSGSFENLLIRGMSRTGDALWDVRVTTQDSFVTPLATLRSGDEVVSVFNYRAQDLHGTGRAQKVLLVRARPSMP